MEIDRKRFLSLVGTIGAAAACASPQPPQAVIVAIDEKPDAAIAPKPMPIASSEPAPVETAVEPESPGASVGIWSRSYDPKAKAYSCADLKCPAPTKEGMGALRGACRSIERQLGTEPFQRFMGCMMDKNNTRSTCDLLLVGERKGECLEGWYTTPTLDPATAAKCKPIVAACAKTNRDPNASGKLSMTQCQQMMSVSSAKGEKQMIHCITEYCEGALNLCHGGYGG